MVRKILNENRIFVQKENLPRLPYTVAYIKAHTAAQLVVQLAVGGA